VASLCLTPENYNRATSVSDYNFAAHIRTEALLALDLLLA
jgi:hypothetical protein